MNKTMKQYKGKVLKAMMMLLAVGFALAGTSTMQNGLMNDDLHNIPHGSRLFWAPGAGQKFSK